jgi:hypothetical protein
MVAGSMVFAALFLASAPYIQAQHASHQGVLSASLHGSGATSGILTNRLSPGKLRTWRKIERIVLARDAGGRCLHPTLERLWREANSSGHRIFVELRTRSPQNIAGKVIIETMDPRERSHALAIHIYLSTINKAITSERARRADGLIPFEKLRGEERYAEVD